MVDGGGGSGSEQAEAAAEADDPRDLFARQVLFARCLAKLILYAEERGYELTLAEVGVQYDRRDIARKPYADGVHMHASLHYARLAADLNLWDGGDWIRDGDAPQWRELGDYWLSLDPLCAWGGDFRSRDSNHVSIRWGGRA